MFNKDFGKDASGLLKNDFPDSLELEFASKCDFHDCFNVTTEVELDPDDSTIGSTIKPSLKLNNNTSVDFEFGSEGVYVAKVVTKNLLKNLKASLTTECKSVQKEGEHSHTQKLTLAADYTPNKSTTASVKFLFPTLALSAPKTTLGAVYVKNEYAIGCEAVTSFQDSPKLETVTGNFQMKKEDLVVSVTGSLAGGNITGALSYYCNLNQSVFSCADVFGAKINWCGPEKGASASVAFGRNFASKEGFGKITASTCGSIGVSYTQNLCDSTNFTVATSVDTGTLLHKTGVALDFEM